MKLKLIRLIMSQKTIDIVKKAGPAVVSITITKDLPKFEKILRSTL